MTGEPRGAFEPADPDFARRTRESFFRQGAMAHLGAVLGRIEPGFVEIALPYRPELSQQHGFFHAGIVATAFVMPPKWPRKLQDAFFMASPAAIP